MEYESEQAGDPDLIVEAKKQQEMEKVKRARITAIAFGAITLVALLSLVYAFVQKGFADEMSKMAEEMAIRAHESSVKANALQMKLEQCAEEAKSAQRLAEQVAEETRRATTKPLKKSSK